MKDEIIIKKAQNALNKLGFTGAYEEVKVIRTENDLLLESFDELKDQYSVSFFYSLPDGRLASDSVDIDKKTNKLIRIVGRHGSTEIPQDLQ